MMTDNSKSRILNLRSRDQIQFEACEWIVRLDSGDPADAALSEFIDWLDAGPLHRDEFIKMAKLWDKTDVISELAHIIPLENQRFTRRPVLFRSRPAKTALACSIVTISIALILSFHHGSEPKTSSAYTQAASYTTAVGEQEAIELADGSSIQLNTDSSLEVSFAADSRDIHLLKGEAHFEVAEDPARPFVVHVAKGRVIAVGTAFNVLYQDDRVKVTVTEGKVKVLSGQVETKPLSASIDAPVNDSSATEALVAAGYSIEFDDVIRSVNPVEPAVVDQKLAWQRGMLILEGDLLEDAIREINRYSDTKIVIKDPEIQKMRVGGYFRIGEIESMLKAFETSFNISVTRVDDVIYLSRQAKAVPDQGGSG